MTPSGFASNRAGGILGGISTGEPIVLRIAVKPPSSIAVPQRTVDLTGHEREFAVGGRHDPCLCPRVVPVAEAMTCLVLADALLRQRSIEAWRPEPAR
jgi:chorismate synthase